MLRMAGHRLTAVALVTGLAALGQPAGEAVAAVVLPTVTTGAARQVSYASAALDGSVNPRGSDASYYFQYGPTKAYGGQTAIADAGAGTHTVGVSLAVGGLQPLTVYHYRLVGVNGGGAADGADRSFMTTKVPLSLAILSTPNPVLFGGTLTVQGTLSGTENANRAVVLQAAPFPFSAGFQNILNPELTSATGSFSFTLAALTQTTQYRVVTSTNPPVVSPVVIEGVAVRVSGHVGQSRRRRFVRIFGTVSPAEDGAQVGILRIRHGRYILVGGTTLSHHTANSSTFSRAVPLVAGVYRVLVRVTNGAQLSNYSRPLLIR
jgi:hypothetical protein